MKIIMIMSCCWLSLTTACARPVSYPGGWTVMQMNEQDVHQLHIHYSPTAQSSIGMKSEYWSDQKIRLNGIQYNRLIKRWNKPQEQANFYFKSGVGMANRKSLNAADDQLAYFTGLAVDWETRQYFTSYENRYYDFNNHGSYFSQKIRLGIAPYIGDFGDLHTWLMVQFDHQPKAEKNFTVTPMVRWFKGSYMFEAGYSSQNDYLLNFIIRL